MRAKDKENIQRLRKMMTDGEATLSKTGVIRMTDKGLERLWRDVILKIDLSTIKRTVR